MEKAIAIFNHRVLDANNRYCKVVTYAASHSNMIVELRHESFDTNYLWFTGVLYYQGTMGWRGIDFR
jgi:hypothetical protein